MDFGIADTFTESLARLSADEQKSAKTAAFDLQMNPAYPSSQFHKLDKAKGQTGQISLSTMHLAKGLECKAVAVMA